jgi:CubicO group peptidase (beta-lactamase class C family)
MLCRWQRGNPEKETKMRQVRVWTFTALLTLLCCGAALNLAQEAPASEFATTDRYIAEAMAEWRIPGLSVAVVRGDEIIYLKGYGTADSSGRPMTPQTPIWLASLSKSITATAIMQLAEAGQLDLDMPITAVIPWFREGMADPSPITIRHLLHHSSGFSTFSGQEVLSDSSISDTALENTVRRLSSAPLQFEPGTAYTYSNSNYDILGYIVQVTAEQPYEDYIAQRIFAPLKMTNAHAYLAEAEGIAQGFLEYFGRVVPYGIPYSRATTPSAGLIASAEDLAHYVIAHLNEGLYEGTALVSPEGMRALHTPGININPYEAYAMGWVRVPLWEMIEVEGDIYTLPAAILHDGSWANSRTFITLIPQERLGVITLMNYNIQAKESAFFGIARNIVMTALGRQPQPVTIYEDSFRQNGVYIGLALVIIWVARFVSAVLTLRHWLRHPDARPRTLAHAARVVLPPALLDALLVWYILAGVPWQFDVPLHTLRAFNPDIGLMMQALLALAGGWGVLRTLVFIALILRSPANAPATS